MSTIYCTGTGFKTYMALMRAGLNVRLVASPKKLIEIARSGDGIVFYHWVEESMEIYRKLIERSGEITIIPHLNSMDWFDRTLMTQNWIKPLNLVKR